VEGSFDEPPQVLVRTERAEEHAVVERVVEQAFGRPEVAELVRRIRMSPGCDPDLSFVAEENGTIVGHTMLSYVELEDGDRRHRVLTMSPVSVLPAAQGRGIGGRLIRAAIERADERGEPLIVLEGSPRYYPRFGFRYSRPFGITIDLPSWAPKEASMVVPLMRYRPDIRGRVVYPPAFDVVAEHGPDEAAP